MGYCPWGHEESDTTEQLSKSMQVILEENFQSRPQCHYFKVALQIYDSVAKDSSKCELLRLFNFLFNGNKNCLCQQGDFKAYAIMETKNPEQTGLKQ